MVQASTGVTFDQMPSVVALKQHFETVTKGKHLRELLQDTERNESLLLKYEDKIMLDFSHTKIDAEGLRLLSAVAEEMKVGEKV